MSVLPGLNEVQEEQVRKILEEMLEAGLPQFEALIVRALQESVDAAVTRLGEVMDPAVATMAVGELQKIVQPLEARLERVEAALFRRHGWDQPRK